MWRPRREAIEEVLEADIQAIREVLEAERSHWPHKRRPPAIFESRVYSQDLTQLWWQHVKITVCGS